MSSPGSASYEVHCSPAVLESIKQLQEKAEAAGLGPACLSAIKTIVQRLKQEPAQLGEPAYRLKTLKLQVWNGFVEPLMVKYAIHDDLPIVFILGIEGLTRFHI